MQDESMKNGPAVFSANAWARCAMDPVYACPVYAFAIDARPAKGVVSPSTQISMLVAYLNLIVWFRSRGGYNPVHLDAWH